MSCACGQHHPRPSAPDGADRAPLPLARPMVALTGRLICADLAQMATALALLPDHARLSRAEPGCLRFDIRQDDDPLVWHVTELFRDDDAFAAHQRRAADSPWGHDSGAIRRDFSRREVMPVIRPEAAADYDAIDGLLQSAFGGSGETRLVRLLRAEGDLHLSLLAEAWGTIIGHVALSHLAAEQAALALAPVAVAPRAQGLGIGSALIRAAIASAADLPVVVLGDPAFYGRFGFVPADLDSPYAGPHLHILGHLPAGSRIGHAPAFARI